MRKTYFIIIALLVALSLNAQEETVKKRNGGFSCGYTILAAFTEYISTIPDETFHTSNFFSRDFSFIKPDETDNHIYLRYLLPPKEQRKWSFGFGVEYLHTKPNRFDEGAGVL